MFRVHVIRLKCIYFLWLKQDGSKIIQKMKMLLLNKRQNET